MNPQAQPLALFSPFINSSATLLFATLLHLLCLSAACRFVSSSSPLPQDLLRPSFHQREKKVPARSRHGNAGCFHLAEFHYSTCFGILINTALYVCLCVCGCLRVWQAISVTAAAFMQLLPVCMPEMWTDGSFFSWRMTSFINNKRAREVGVMEGRRGDDTGAKKKKRKQGANREKTGEITGLGDEVCSKHAFWRSGKRADKGNGGD